MSVYEPNAEEMAAWKEASQPVYDDFIENSGELGAEVLKAAQGL